MKKFITILALALAMASPAAFAQHRGGGYRGGYHGGYHGCYGCGWIAPLVVGGAVVYGLTRSYEPPPPPVVYIEPQAQPATPPGCTRIISRDAYGRVITDETRCN